MLAGGEESNEQGGSSLFGLIVKLALLFLFVNFFIQIVRKPTEVLRFAHLGRTRSPRETWNKYGEDFRSHATDVITADLLAALTQVESAGDSLSSPGWTWHWSRNPWRWYSPESSAVGLLQMTDGNFGAARALCVKNGHVATEGAWYDLDSCRFNGSYSRLVGSHSIEMTSAFLHVSVERALSHFRGRASLRDKQKLAAVMHLCGPNKGPEFVRAGFDVGAMGFCGTQRVSSYVRLVMKYRAQFARWSAEEDGSVLTSATAASQTEAETGYELSRLGSYTRMQPFRR